MALAAQSITFGYSPDRPVLRALSAALEPGKVTAILGPNGAGKSTLLRLLLGLATPNAGRITLDGADVHSIPRSVRARRLVYIPQHSTLAFAFTVRAVVGMGLYASGESSDSARADHALAQLDLTAVADTPFGLLSAGQQQRVTLARALAQLALPAPPGTRVLLADEPAAAMDPRHALTCLALLRSLAAGGLAVGVVLHDLSAVLRYADEAIVLDSSGSLAAVGPVHASVTAPVLGPVFGVPFREVLDSGRRVGLRPVGPDERLDETP